MNRLKVAKVHSILTLASRGWSFRRIAEALGVDRQTVANYVHQARAAPNPAKAPSGSEGPESAMTGPPAGSPAAPAAWNPAKAPSGSEAPAPGRSGCESYRQLIVAKLDQGLSAQRIWQDLVAEQDAAVSYYSVRRFVGKLRSTRPLPFRRLECDPGAEGQVDFGKGAPVVTATGRRRRTKVFRIALSCSRKAYSEAVYHPRSSTGSTLRD